MVINYKVFLIKKNHNNIKHNHIFWEIIVIWKFKYLDFLFIQNFFFFLLCIYLLIRFLLSYVKLNIVVIYDIINNLFIINC
jgi:hypothetical protein